MRQEIEFHLGDIIPPVPPGYLISYLVIVHRKTAQEKGREPRTFAAYYLNEYPLEYSDGCGACPDDGSHDDGCPTTGWFRDESNFEYDNCYYKLLGEGDKLIGWASIPQPTDALLAALSFEEQNAAPRQQEGQER